MSTYDELWSNYKNASTPLEKCEAMALLKTHMVSEAQRNTLEGLYNTQTQS